jgi:hypothetical protein
VIKPKSKAPSASTVPTASLTKSEIQSAPADSFVRVWESKGLTKRDLNIPTGKTTNPTGSMLWKKGAANIEQRHFFRNEAFEGLDWKIDPKKLHYERVKADFEIVIKGLNYGKHTLKLSHNTDTKSRSYEQKNSMTQVHWGSVLKLIAKQDLLGRVMSLYRKDGNPPQYLIEID